MTKKEIDAKYYQKNKDKVKERVSKYQREHPESHRKASREYEMRNYKKVKIIGEIIPDKVLGNKVIYKRN